MRRFKIFNLHSYALFLILAVILSCQKENSPDLIEEKTWSSTAPHRPTVSDLNEKISGFLIEGARMNSPNRNNPQFVGFTDSLLFSKTEQTLSENQVTPARIEALLQYYSDTSFQKKVLDKPNTARLLITSITHENEVVKKVSEATFTLLSNHLNYLQITDDFPGNSSGSSALTLRDRTVLLRSNLYDGSEGEDIRGVLFNEASEIAYLLEGITTSRNAQILQVVLQALYNMHDYRAFLDNNNSESVANLGIRDNLASLFLTLYRPSKTQEQILNGRFLNHPDALRPEDNPDTETIDESEHNSLGERIDGFRVTLYSGQPNIPDQRVPLWMAEQYKYLTGFAMPNGNVADQAAIELAEAVCNSFLNERPLDRQFIIDYYGVNY